MKILILSIVAFFQFLSGNVSEFLNTDSLTEKIEADSTIHQTQLLQEWVLTEGWFNEGPLVFERKDTAIHQGHLYRVFSFQKDESIRFQFFNTRKRPMKCSVGLAIVNEGSWRLEDNRYLKVHIKGGDSRKKEFEYETRYLIEHISSKKLKLVVDRKILSSEKNF